MSTYERPTEYQSVVLYDADCPYCSAATKALKRVDGLGAVSWDEPVAQSFLQAQFGETPYAVVLVDEDAETVYVGSAAARELAGRAGLPDLVNDIIESEFDRLEATIDRLGGYDEPPSELDGQFELSAEASGVYPDLAYAAWTLPTR